MELWTGTFWDWLLYPEVGSSQVPDPSTLLARALQELGGSFPDFVFCLSLDEFTQEKVQLLDEAEERVSKRLPRRWRLLLGFAHSNCLYGAGFEEGAKVGIAFEKLQKDLERERIANTIGFAAVVGKTLPAWRWAAQMAAVAQRNKIFHGSGRVYYSHQLQTARSYDHLFCYAQEEELYASIRTGEDEKAGVAADKLDGILFGEYPPLYYLRIRLQEIILRMGRCAVESGAEAKEIFPSLQNYILKVGSQYDYERLQGILREAALECAERVWEVCSRQGTQITQAARRFMEKNYGAMLSLDEIAEQIGTSSSYLSRRFKQEMGQSVTSYLNAIRIEEAKKLLLDESLPITEVAFKVGYGSVQHFGRTFKAHTGYSPTSWRRNRGQALYGRGGSGE